MRRLRNLLDGLPVEARCRQEDPDDPASSWGSTEELLAQLIEEVSVLAADRRRKEPRQLPRPKPRRSKPVEETIATKHGGLLAAAMKRRQVRYG